MAGEMYLGQREQIAWVDETSYAMLPLGFA